jgi:hypothetical protein
MMSEQHDAMQRLVVYALFGCLGMATLVVVGQTIFLIRHWQ